jgi:hypothetical protein
VYLWLPSIIGSTKFADLPGGGAIEIEQSPGEYLKALNFAFMGTVEARRGPYSFLFDGIYLNMGTQDAKVRSISGPNGSVSVPVDTGSQLKIAGFLGGLAGGYTISQSPGTTVDAIGGARYFRMETTAEWHLAGPAGVLAKDGRVEKTKDLWDGFVGVRGTTALAERWSLRYYADVGGGSSELTWQAMGGVAYRYNWGDLVVGYRHLAYDFDKDRFVSDVKLSGPVIAGTFHF